jgi:hypothetical protein
LSVLDTLGKELDGQEAGAKAAARAKQIRADPATAKELDASEAWEKTKKECAKLGTGKAKDKYKEFAKKYAGTRAGEQAAARARG